MNRIIEQEKALLTLLDITQKKILSEIKKLKDEKASTFNLIELQKEQISNNQNKLKFNDIHIYNNYYNSIQQMYESLEKLNQNIEQLDNSLDLKQKEFSIFLNKKSITRDYFSNLKKKKIAATNKKEEQSIADQYNSIKKEFGIFSTDQ